MKKLMAKLRQNKGAILQGALLFVLMLVLCRASIVKTISPFGFSFAFSLVILQKNAIWVSFCYFLSAILFNLSLEGLICVLVTTSCLILFFLVFRLLKKVPNFFAGIVFLIFSQAGYLYFNIHAIKDLFVCAAMILVAIMFVYVCTQAFGALFYRGISCRLTIDESICFSLFMVALFSGLYGLEIAGVNLTGAIVTLLVLCCSRAFKKTTTVYFSTLAGFGLAFASASVIPIAIFATFGVLASTLADKNRFFAPILIVAADVVFGMFLNAYANYSYKSLILLVAVLAAYVCIPQKVFDLVRGHTYNYDGSLASEYILAGQKAQLKKRLEKTSNLFRLMQSAYRTLSIGQIDRKAAAGALAEDLAARHCKNCVLFDECYASAGIKKSIADLFEFGLAKGKVTLIDPSNLLTETCRGLSSLIEEVNASIETYFDYEKTIKSEDSKKLLISEQLGSTSEVLSELASITLGGESINQKLSAALLDEFTINQLVVSEVVVLQTDEGTSKVIAVVKNTDALQSKLTLCLKNVLHLNFAVVSRQMTRLAGWSIVCFAPAPRYKVQVGYAGKGKDGNVSGDTYSLVNLGENKFLFALSDGMGHGTRAHQISAATLGLVEGFYKAGFSSQTILGSVNKLLVPAASERFACLDACIVNTTLATADFVKVGASISLVKSQNTTKIIEGASLPLGIVSQVKTTTSREILKDQDIVVLASDGVVDSFASFEEYSNYVNNERVINVQMLADSILEEAQSREGQHTDDMSVITIKITACV